MVIKNKKAWIRILEASIAIMIIASVLLTLYIRSNPSVDKEDYFYELGKRVLDKIYESNSLRESVLSEQEGVIKEFVESELPSNVGFDLCIAEIDVNCGFVDVEKEVYVQERIFVASLFTYSPKKLRLFLWEN